MSKHIKISFVSQFSKQARSGHQDRLVDKLKEDSEEYFDTDSMGICKHNDYCNIKKFGRINCISGQKYCQIYKFYEKNGGKI